VKLATRVPPRRDGTVRVRGAADVVYVFQADGLGERVCEVDDAQMASALVATGGFMVVADEPPAPAAPRRKTGPRVIERITPEVVLVESGDGPVA
jgi:hypothetical protein